MCYTWK